jgi:hypothetical protein
MSQRVYLPGDRNRNSGSTRISFVRQQHIMCAIETSEKRTTSEATYKLTPKTKELILSNVS